jgi:hypothetical protein
MSPIGIICNGKILGQGHKVSMKKKIEITILQLENKQKKMTGEDKVGSTFKRTSNLTTFKSRWHRW